ncbi:putative mitochondrial medium-chain specific acyl-CoA dehydrogenase precursor [Cercophora samala]|uniref:Mitochondrial medium-chain specific acyl-CoA dehydrogenase n=1 Tax=Cercophora samala TaxID=330535 RepID=A0AA39YXI5_9PEZI|nr:putative mitochondrial medium-chain specific acyl-CoA dehydrogenase precursor [Cercophora samala]
MPIDFHLSASQEGTYQAARSLARNLLLPARQTYLQHPPNSPLRFQSTQPTYAAAVSAGILKGQVSPALGGTGGTLIESAILVEECYSVEPSAALTIFATGLGLTPLNLAAGPQHAEFLAPFLSGEGSPLASLVFSEPGGVANALEKGAPGFQTTAKLEGDEWVINGEKMWATNCAGWDFKGCDLACVVCRDVTTPLEEGQDPKDKVMIILVTRADLDRNGEGAFEVLRHVATPGHTSVSGPHVRYTNVRVPTKNVLCPPGQGSQVAFGAFDGSAVLVGAMGVGLMRAAFDAALTFAKGDNRGGAVPLLERQAFADLLSGVKMQTEAARALTWKAAHAIENGPGDYDARRELALAAKVFCSEAAVKACTDVINAVGITAYDLNQPFSDLLNTAIVLPIFDGGNVGIRRRHMQQLMLKPTYDAWAATYGPSVSE